MKAIFFFTGIILIIAGCSTEHLPLMVGLCITGLGLMLSAMPERGE